MTYDVRDNRAFWDGRELREWVPELVAAIVDQFDPALVLLFGSVADHTDGPDSDIDLLVVLDHAPIAERRRLMFELRRAARAISAPHDLLVTSIEDFERNRRSPGTTEYEPATNGVVVYERSSPEAIAAQRWMRRLGAERTQGSSLNHGHRHLEPRSATRPLQFVHTLPIRQVTLGP